MAGDGAEGARKRRPAKRKAEEEAVAAAAPPPLPPAKNMMRRETVEYILSWKSQPYQIPLRREDRPEVAKQLAENQARIKKEVEEKGYVHVPDGYEEEVRRCNRDAFRSAYLEVYGCLPPEEDD